TENDLETNLYVLATILRGEMEDLAAAAGAPCVWLLLYDAHRLAALAQPFLEDFLGPFSPLMDPPGPLRALLSFSRNPVEPGAQAYQAGVDALMEFVSKQHVQHETLGPFKPPRLDPLPYLQFLLQYETPYTIPAEVLNGPAHPKRDKFFAKLWELVEGVPSRLSTPTTTRRLEDLLQLFGDQQLVDFLQPANYDTTLRELAAAAGA